MVRAVAKVVSFASRRRIDRHHTWLPAQNIEVQPGEPARYGVAAYPRVAEAQLPGGEAGERVGLDVVRVEVLGGDAVAKHHDRVTVLEWQGLLGNGERDEDGRENYQERGPQRGLEHGAPP